jgi:F0F1-type ATP synthase assembly protein I
VTDETPGWSTLLGIGLTTAVILVACFAIGWLLDRAMDTSPAMVLVGLAVGIVVGGVYTVQQMRRFTRQ